jgi:hypothetical protein
LQGVWIQFPALCCHWQVHFGEGVLYLQGLQAQIIGEGIAGIQTTALPVVSLPHSISDHSYSSEGCANRVVISAKDTIHLSPESKRILQLIQDPISMFSAGRKIWPKLLWQAINKQHIPIHVLRRGIHHDFTNFPEKQVLSAGELQSLLKNEQLFKNYSSLPNEKSSFVLIKEGKGCIILPEQNESDGNSFFYNQTTVIDQ